MGFEPTTSRLLSGCSTNQAKEALAPPSFVAQGRASKKRIRARKVCRARLRAEAAPHGSAQLLDAQTRHVQTTVHFPFGGFGSELLL